MLNTYQEDSVQTFCATDLYSYPNSNITYGNNYCDTYGKYRVKQGDNWTSGSTVICETPTEKLKRVKLKVEIRSTLWFLSNTDFKSCPKTEVLPKGPSSGLIDAKKN